RSSARPMIETAPPLAPSCANTPCTAPYCTRTLASLTCKYECVFAILCTFSKSSV
ncbi:hypothetical protein EI94DRAFT_1751842, partial [Lactarius quietus]